MPIPLLVVIGPTASGKSALAVALGKALGGEVINADAFAVYRDMNIGTAKPTAAEQQGIPHHVLSVIDCAERSDVNRWLALAQAALTDIHERGHVPIVAGGTPLYVKALLEGLSAGAPRDPDIRAALEKRYDNDGAAALFAQLQKIDPVYAADRHPNDRRRIVRALEVYEITGQPYSSFHTTDGVRRTDVRPLLIGLEWQREVIYERIDARAKDLFAQGLVDEVRALAGRISPEAAQAVGYKEVLAYLRGEYDLERAVELVQQKSRNLAKHQLTWYRGWSDIQWLPGDAEDLVERSVELWREWVTSTS